VTGVQGQQIAGLLVGEVKVSGKAFEGERIERKPSRGGDEAINKRVGGVADAIP
jgi:hypothetical protein